MKIIAEELKVPTKDVWLMAQRLNNYDQSFDAPMLTGQNGEDDWGSPESYLGDHSQNPEQLCEQYNQHRKQHSQLHHGLSTLDERSQDIIQQRWLNDKKSTLNDLAEQYQISAERVRQLEQSAFNKLKSLLN